LIKTDILKKVTAPQIEIELPDPATDGRVSFYGYDVGMEWLVNYATKHLRWDGQYDDMSKASAAIQLLMSRSGAKRLEFEAALVDHTVPPDAVTIPGNRPGEIRVPLISIFSNERPSFKKRPSQEQVDRLSQIIGKQPRWWVDYEDPRSYDY
jgi:hypothetical protein